MNHLRVLVIEKQDFLRKQFIQRIEKIDGVGSMFQTADRHDFISAVNQYYPDIVIYGLGLVDKSQIEYIKTALLHFRDVKVIGMAFHYDHEYLELFMESGLRGLMMIEHFNNEIEEAIKTVIDGGFYFKNVN